METLERKLELLARIGAAFNARGIRWGLGASALLYCRGLVEDFHDLDLLVELEDAPLAREVLSSLGRFLGAPRHPSYCSKSFAQYEVEGVKVDLIGGFAIRERDRVWDCSFQEEQIEGQKTVCGVEIPLMKLSLWEDYYEKMGRPQKAACIASWRKAHPQG